MVVRVSFAVVPSLLLSPLVGGVGVRAGWGAGDLPVIVSLGSLTEPKDLADSSALDSTRLARPNLTSSLVLETVSLLLFSSTAALLLPSLSIDLTPILVKLVLLFMVVVLINSLLTILPILLEFGSVVKDLLIKKSSIFLLYVLLAGAGDPGGIVKDCKINVPPAAVPDSFSVSCDMKKYSL